MTLLLTVILVALVFEYINGFHDTANSIATVVSTKALTPRQAIVLAAITNLLGALVGTAVAKTISSGLVDAQYVTTQTIICALLGGIVWNLLTWWYGLASSSSHALVGGLCGAVLASAHGNWSALIWSKIKTGAPWFKNDGILYKVVLPMVLSPTAGFLLGLFFMTLLYFLCRNWRPRTITAVFGKLQLASAAYMGFSHGSNDAQKTMGIIALTLVAATKTGVISDTPGWFHFLYTPEAAKGQSQEIALWIKLACALVMALGTAAGGWKIIKTIGQQLVKMQPIHGFAASTTGATVLMVAAHFGMPVSTTHAVTTSIMGVGCAKRFSALKFSVVEKILTAWILTLPATALLGYLFMRAVQILGF
ncbi:MAG: inorganic phosphate transporter [Pedosphaera sp.]|nr:inorganic phosphate transporter [Pedosphaera sp.]